MLLNALVSLGPPSRHAEFADVAGRLLGGLAYRSAAELAQAGMAAAAAQQQGEYLAHSTHSKAQI